SMCAEEPIFASCAGCAVWAACGPGMACPLSPSATANDNRIVSAALLRVVRFTLTCETTGSLLPVPPTWPRRPARHCTRDVANIARAKSRPWFDGTAACGEAGGAHGAHSRHRKKIVFAG